MGGAIVRPVYVTLRRSWADIVRAGAEPVHWPKRYGYAEWVCRVLERWSRRYSLFVDRVAVRHRATRLLSRVSGNPGASMRSMPEGDLVCGVWVYSEDVRLRDWRCDVCGGFLMPPAPEADSVVNYGRPIRIIESHEITCGDPLCAKVRGILDEPWRWWPKTYPNHRHRLTADEYDDLAAYILIRLRRRARHKRGLGIYPSVFPELRGV